MNEQKTTKELPACPVETTLTLIGNKWKVLILRDLMPGTKRFGELKKSIGSVSQKVLTAQLRDMEASGLVDRKVYAEVPPRVEYSLTKLGKSLEPVLEAMRNWGEDYKTYKV
ncbi:MAG: winged helix-turn-helix transcriptional regulator [Acutalibacteraceae bacterium]